MSNYAYTLSATVRQDNGKGASRRLRREGLVPAIVYGGEEPEPDVQDRFVDTLRRAGITTTVRDTRGSDIDGACGQLAAEVLNQETARRIR